MRDLHILPKFREGWSYLYVEHCRVDQEDKAIAVHDAQGKVPVPCACLSLLMLGPGTSVTHAAMRVLADHGCTVLWTGEEGVRMYAQGIGETRRSANMLHQARLWADSTLHQQVIVRLYSMRFAESLPTGLTLKQLRGREGVRVREAYAAASRDTGVTWAGRTYKRDEWKCADPVNRALSAANSCLYGLCHAAILSAGFSPALGFIHTGKQLSFVYDVADLYKAQVTIPAAFQAVQQSELDGAADLGDLERYVRLQLRDLFQKTHLMRRIVQDIGEALSVDDAESFGGGELGPDYDLDGAFPGALWDDGGGTVPGGENYGSENPGFDETALRG
jgi:CRISPR-associated protein Cas1